MIHKKKLSVYIHIPFCQRKCLYCDFLSRPGGEEERSLYVEKLCQEIRAESLHYKDYEIMTVFLGGGTPSLLSGEQMGKILSCLRGYYAVEDGAEITVEMNPGTVTADKLSAYREAGANRASLGLQSADNGQLRMLGRIHTWEQFLESYRLCREAGFLNINIDIMSALPGQTYRSYMDTLQKAAALQPEHISAYSLIIEEGTPFYDIYGGGQREGGGRGLPDEETERAMYEGTKRSLAGLGYERYEISNYAKKGMECAHNCVYWTRGDYAGFGLGASSMVNNVRWANVRRLSEYNRLPAGEKKENRYTLTTAEQMEETMYLGLRMAEGVSRERFAQTFGYTVEEIYGAVIRKHAAQGLLETGSGRIRLTDRGIDVSNYVMADFLL